MRKNGWFWVVGALGIAVITIAAVRIMSTSQNKPSVTGIETVSKNLTNENDPFITRYRQLSPQSKEKLIRYADALADAEKQTNSSQKRPANETTTESKAIESESKTPVIWYKEAKLYIGKEVTVEGTVVASYNSGKAVFLNFERDYKKSFTAVIFASDFNKFPDAPESAYLNREVRVSGTVKEYQGKAEIILNSPEKIKIITK